MLRLFFLAATFFLPSLPAFAESDVVVKIGEGKTVSIRLLEPENAECGFEVYQDGKLIQTETPLGRDVAEIVASGKARKVSVFDIDRDGVQEFVVRTTQPPFIGALWFFRWLPKDGKFASIDSASGDNYVPVPLGVPVNLDKKGKFTFASGPGPKARKMSYHWNGKRFVK